ncbi:MAG: exo-alpha-sialidase [Bacteroidota bacterium]|nr:exo-alpha-sialidase [Bacteroidota bacterium]
MREIVLLVVIALLLVNASCKKDDKDQTTQTQQTSKAVANFTFSTDNSKYPFLVVNYTNISTNATSYIWDFGDGQTSTEKNHSHTFHNDGTFQTKLTAVSSGGNSTISKGVTVYAPELASATLAQLSDVTIREVYGSTDTTVYDHIAFPDIAKLSDGRLIVTWREATAHMQNGQGKIMKSFGSGDGITWTNAELLYDDPKMDDRDFSITRLSNGTLLGDFFKSYDGGTFITKSTDDGKTFSAPVRINTLSGWAIPSAQTIDYNGTLWIPTYGNDGTYSKSRIFMFKSNNMGDSWTEEAIAPDNMKNWDLQEPAILKANNNRLIMHVRTANSVPPYGMGNMFQSISDDGGKTWSTWKSFPFIGHAPELYRTESGVIISAFRWIDNTASHSYVGMIYSTDNGSTWSDVIHVAESDYECGYPGIESLGNDKFIVVYYRTLLTDNNTNIKMQIRGTIFQCNAVMKSKKK